MNGVNQDRADAIQIYPNPAEEVLHLSGIKEKSTFEIFDSIGRIVLSGELKVEKEIYVGKLQQGIYTLLIEGVAREMWKVRDRNREIGRTLNP